MHRCWLRKTLTTSVFPASGLTSTMQDVRTSNVTRPQGLLLSMGLWWNQTHYYCGHLLLAYCTNPGSWMAMKWGKIGRMNEWQENPKHSEKTSSSAARPTTDPAWLDPGLNPSRRGGKPATNRLSYRTADRRVTSPCRVLRRGSRRLRLRRIDSSPVPLVCLLLNLLNTYRLIDLYVRNESLIRNPSNKFCLFNFRTTHQISIMLNFGKSLNFIGEFILAPTKLM
jgi:hypothetical protein